MSSRAWFGVDFKQQLLEKKFTLDKMTGDSWLAMIHVYYTIYSYWRLFNKGYRHKKLKNLV
jgi:hypothetical protein